MGSGHLFFFASFFFYVFVSRLFSFTFFSRLFFFYVFFSHLFSYASFFFRIFYYGFDHLECLKHLEHFEHHFIIDSCASPSDNLISLSVIRCRSSVRIHSDFFSLKLFIGQTIYWTFCRPSLQHTPCWPCSCCCYCRELVLLSRNELLLYDVVPSVYRWQNASFKDLR